MLMLLAALTIHTYVEDVLLARYGNAQVTPPNILGRIDTTMPVVNNIARLIESTPMPHHRPSEQWRGYRVRHS